MKDVLVFERGRLEKKLADVFCNFGRGVALGSYDMLKDDSHVMDDFPVSVQQLIVTVADNNKCGLVPRSIDRYLSLGSEQLAEIFFTFGLIEVRLAKEVFKLTNLRDEIQSLDNDIEHLSDRAV